MPRLQRCALMLCFVLSATPVTAEEVDSFEKARERARDTGSPIVLDFYTTWCQPCHVIDKDTTENATLRAALEKVVLLRVDGWNSKHDQPLSLRYRVRGFPTFVVVDADGREKNRWVGYEGPDKWVASLASVLEAHNDIGALIQRYETEPTVEIAEHLVTYYRQSNNPMDAVALYEDLLRWQPERKAELRWATFDALAESYGRDHNNLERLRQAHEAVLAFELSARQWTQMAVLLKPIAWQVDDLSWYASVIPGAIKAGQGSEDRYVQAYQGRFAEDKRMYIDGEAEQVLAKRRSELEPNWKQKVQACMNFGTWCQENRIHMEEAQRALEDCLSQAPDETPPVLFALAWSTLADLRATRGQYASAVDAVAKAIEFMPGVPELYDALRRYESQVED